MSTLVSKSRVVLLLVLAGFVLPAAGQEEVAPALLEWQAVRSNVFAATAVEPLAGQDSEILREFGLVNAERWEYGKGNATLRVIIYRMKDTSGAFGVYTFLGSAGMTAADVGERVVATAAEGRALALRGSWVVEVSASPARDVTAELRAVLSMSAGERDTTPYPTLPQYLPTAGKVRDSERYALGPAAMARFLQLGKGDWVGFAAGAEVQMAKYRAGGRELSLVLIAYPTPQAASHRMGVLSETFDIGNLAKDSREDLYIRRIGSLLAIVVGAASHETADAILKGVSYETELTWNEPGHRATERFDLMLKTVFVGTAVLTAFVFIASIAFGGFRLLIKRVLPGKVFDRPESIEVLQLGLGSKPIEAKDFYSRT